MGTHLFGSPCIKSQMLINFLQKDRNFKGAAYAKLNCNSGK